MTYSNSDIMTELSLTDMMEVSGGGNYTSGGGSTGGGSTGGGTTGTTCTDTTEISAFGFSFKRVDEEFC
jgi:hypothetical protein